jgi:hypothetical protein
VNLPNEIDGTIPLPLAVREAGGTAEDARVAANIMRPGHTGAPNVQDALAILRHLVNLPNAVDNPELRNNQWNNPS